MAQQNIYEKYQVKQVINASGKMTILGGSKVSDTIGEAMKTGAKNFYLVKDLQEQVGKYLANLLDVEAVYMVNSASGGIAQSVAAAIAKDNEHLILNMYDPRCDRREIVLPKGHNVNYGTPVQVPIEIGGGVVVEAGYANECTIGHVEQAITDKTAALVYVKSHHAVQKGMPTAADYIAVGKRHNIPVIVDAAAEEDLQLYVNLGADVVIYSGTKALEGPTSGLLIGTKEMLELIKLQGLGLGRVMKIGKEGIIGLATAIEQYTQRVGLTLAQQVQRMEAFHATLSAIPGISVQAVQDGAGRAIMRSELTFDAAVLGIDALAITAALKNGPIQIYTRDYRANEGKIEIDIRDVSDDELQIITDAIIEKKK